jgi:hypothetical protein
MAQNVSSKGREQPAYMSYHQDGLLDLAIGVAVLLAGVYALVDLDVPLGAAWVVLWLPIWLAAKKSITARRAPNIEISKAQYEGMWRAAAFVIAVLVLLVLAGLVLLWGRNAGFVPEEFVVALAERLMPVLGLVGTLVFGAAAWLSGLKRLYVYALLTAVALVGGYLFSVPFALAVTAVAAGVTVWGTVLLVRFVRTHPIQEV